MLSSLVGVALSFIRGGSGLVGDTEVANSNLFRGQEGKTNEQRRAGVKQQGVVGVGMTAEGCPLTGSITYSAPSTTSMEELCVYMGSEFQDLIIFERS